MANFEYLDENSRETVFDLMDGDKELIVDLVDTLIDSNPDLIDQLNKALETGDAKGVRDSAHTLKSSNLQLGATDFADMCQKMEYLGKSNQLNEAATLFPSLKEEYGEVISALESWKDHVLEG
ncbi:Hpt domain-containing protein [Pontibacter sp. G13]|uniref:Hpt domain-containing protein n=1 Tax=Pontibacter sp. G13 TaxID=3074898 RepID=UPI00288B85D7|nr:Hpt domain-containing protein [Pontibacter sp. G13]WNJ18861.1 Hpt domain-containing protein [Pontibacter sp. G13]